jgi:hypothetical protein
MSRESTARCQIVDVATGLWLWRVEHPDWKPGQGWERSVSSTCVETGGEVRVLDPIAPPRADDPVWTCLDHRAPTAIVVLKPDHVRHVDPLHTRAAYERALTLEPWRV